MESVAGFDVVAVVARAAAMDVGSASAEELAWGDRAADRLRAWFDAWQSRVRFQLTLPPPLPPDPRDGLSDGDEACGPEASAVPRAEGSGSEPLPSLGSQPPAVDSPQEALRKQRRAWLLAELPGFVEALQALRVTTAHVDLLAASVDKLPSSIQIRVFARGDELLRVACQCTADRFGRTISRVIAAAYDDEGIERAQRQRSQSGLRHGVDQATGMRWLHLDIDPERGAVLFERLRNEREAIFHAGQAGGLNSAQVDLQALLNLLSAPGSEQRSSTKRAHVSVIVDIETLLHGAHDRSVCEAWSGAPLTPESVRSLLCDAETAFGFTIAGRVVLQVANVELATKDQRRELRMMYRSCIGPDCDRPFDQCQIHHVIPRNKHGPTAIPLMVPLCNGDHDAIHHGGWTLAIDERRTITWTAPDGTDRVYPYVRLADHGQPSLFDTAPPRRLTARGR